jgi:SAM-dependent methyltransferase
MAEPVPHFSTDRLAAEAWAEVREPLDRQLSPLGLRAIDALAPSVGDVIVDVGCGAGQTVLQLSDRVGPQGRVIGVDIARRLLDIARERSRGVEQISFVECDAGALKLPPGSVDGVFSRFGVMALSDHVAAFSNFHRMLRPDGRIAFVCWRSLEENELDFLPLRAAGLERLLDPTPFSLEDPAHARAILEAAGFRNVEFSAHDEAVTSGDLEAMMAVVLRVGPLGRIIREYPALRAAAEPRVRAALAAKGNPTCVALRAATWIVSARA